MENETDIGANARRIIAFFQGAAFKIVAGIFAIGAIVYAVLTGGVPASRIPAPNEQVQVAPRGGMATRPGSDQSQPRVDDRGSSARQRFDAYQEGNNK